MAWKAVGDIQFTPKQRDAIDQLLDNKIWVGQVYKSGKEERHVVMVFMPRGAFCLEREYEQTLKYTDDQVPRVSYKVGNDFIDCPATEFIAWLAPGWTADPVPKAGLDPAVIEAGRAYLGVGAEKVETEEYEKKGKEWRSPGKKKK